MKIKDVVLILVVVFLAVIFLVFLSGIATGNSIDRLSREEQIQIMKECWMDASGGKRGSVFRYSGFTQGGETTQQWIVATAFFQYRTKDR